MERTRVTPRAESGQRLSTNGSRWAALGALLAIGCFAPLSAQDQFRQMLAADFQNRLDEIVTKGDGILGIEVIDVTSGRAFGVNEALVFPQGSAIKVSVLLALYSEDEAGRLSLADRVAIRAQDREGGSGFLRYFADSASEVALHDLAVFMVVVSDNMATNLLVDRVGLERINSLLDRIGLRDTRMRRKMMRTQESANDNENTSTPAEAAQLMSRIGACDLPLTKEHCDSVRAILEIRHPHPSPFQDAAGPGILVAEKNGWFTGVRATWAFVDLPGRPFAVAVMGTYSDSDLVLEVERQVASECFRYFSRLAGATSYGTRVPLDLLLRSGPPGG